MSTGSLNQKRILVTDVESDFGKDIANAVVAEGALVFTLVKECHGVQQVLDEYPQLTPILLDIGKEKCQDQAKKLLLSLPSVDHFVNLSGDVALNVISQAYTNSK
ncbi:unnamed protein product [Orchesella dallaii]|uniref:Uncharacterized protein n=1 Tax=Orchesella dallaii TaxID=48710 RepID=A0ABP1PS06_9HEXA